MNKKKIGIGFDDQAQKDLTSEFINSGTSEFVRKINPAILTPTKASITDLLYLDNTSELAKTKLIKEIENILKKIEELPINEEKKTADYLTQTETTLHSLHHDTTKLQEELYAKNKIYPNEKEYFEETAQMIKNYKKMVKITIEIHRTIKMLLPKIDELYSKFPHIEQWIKEETNPQSKNSLNDILQIRNEIKRIFGQLRTYGRDIRYNIFSFEEIEATIQEAKNCIKYLSDLTK